MDARKGEHRRGARERVDLDVLEPAGIERQEQSLRRDVATPAYVPVFGASPTEFGP